MTMGLCSASSSYYLLFDHDFSPYSSAPGFILIHHSLEIIEDEFVKNLETDNRYVKYLGRAAELLFLWEPTNELMVVTQKEIFGTGYQARALPSVSVKNYKIRVPFPFGTGGGNTNYHIKRSSSINDLLLMNIGGVNATAILANRIKMKSLDLGYIDGRSASFYIESEQDLISSLQRAQPNYNLLLEDNSTADYIKWLNIAYPENEYNLRYLQKLSFINLVDPITFYAGFSALQFVINRTPTKIYGFPINKSNYLPNLRLGLAPYGPEIFFENFLNIPSQTIYFYLKMNQILDKNSLGMGIEYPKIFQTEFFSLGFRADIWKQVIAKSPFNFFEMFERSLIDQTNELIYENVWGGSLSLILEQSVPGSPISLFAQLGAKTKGFLPGEPYNGNPIARFGVGVFF